MSKLPLFYFTRRWRRFAAGRLRPRKFWLLAVAPQLLKLPECCACCGRQAGVCRRESGVNRDHCVIVPYCEFCARHVNRSALLRLGAIWGSVLLGAMGAVLLNLSWLPIWAILIVAVGLSFLPWGAALWFGLGRQLGHSARGTALSIDPRGVVMTSSQFTFQVAETNELIPRQVISRQLRFGVWAVVGPLSALILSPAFYLAFRPTMRVLNFSDNRLSLYVDDHRLGDVDPTSGESPAAGRAFRVPNGARNLVVRSGAGIFADVNVTLLIGHAHLFAPGAKDGCIYVQRMAYGRSTIGAEGRAPVTQVTELRADTRFWVVPSDVEPWFVPERPQERGVTTGGVVSLLRIGRCR